jgi:hypothetical protein
MRQNRLLRGFAHKPAIDQPAFLNSWLVWAGLAAALLIPFFLPIAQGLRRHPIIGALGEQLHIPLLAGIMLLVYWRGPLRGRLWWAALTTAIIGGLIEGVQTLVGRSALFADWVLDLVGIGLVVGFVLWRGHGRSQGKWLLIALLLYIPGQLWRLPFSTLARYEARQTFPVIGDFEGRQFHWLWKATNRSEVGFAPSDSLHGQVLQLTGNPISRWPGARMTHFPEDWSSYTHLVFEARAPRHGGENLPFGVRIDDWEGRKDKLWANQRFFATEEWYTYRMKVADRAMFNGLRQLDLGDVEALLFFVGHPTDTFQLEIDNIRLQ